MAHADRAAETQRTRPQRPAARPQRGLKIGYVIDRFPRASHDFLLQEILALQSRGVEVHVFSLGSPDGRIDETAAAMARVRIPVRYFSSDLASGLAANGMTASQARWVADLVMIRGIEHLHAHGATAPADITRQAGRLARVGYSFTAYADGLYEGADAPALREKIQDAKFAVTLNNFDRGHLLRICGADVARKLHRVPMGLNPKERPFASAEYHDSDSVLAVGPLVEKSGFTDLIESIAMLRDRGRLARLTIVGEGEFDATLREHIDRYRVGRQVRLIGSVSRSELTTLMRVHAALALPWASEDCDRALLANLVLEAMAVGLPVLSTELPGIRELIDDGMSGRVISARDPLWLAGVLETLFDSPVLREHMARRARSIVEWRFAASRNVSHLARLFSEAMAGKRVAAT